MKKYPLYNDYEIISLIQEGHEDAFSLMVDKYSRFIAKKIHKFNLYYDYEDLYQESLLILYKSIKSFDEGFNKTFTKFLELNLERYFITYIRTAKSRKNTEVNHYQEIKQYNHRIKENSVYFYAHLEEVKKVLTELEYRVYILREIKNYDIEFISETLGLSSKAVYNSLHRAKSKIKAYFKG